MNTPKIPDYFLEQFVVNGLPPQKFNSIQAAVKNNDRLEETIDQIKNQNKDYLRKHPAKEVCRNILNQYEKEKSYYNNIALNSRSQNNYHWWHIAIVPSSVAVITIALFLFSPLTDNITPPAPADENINPLNPTIEITRAKGQPRLKIFNESSNILENNDTVKNGDRIRIEYVSMNTKYGTVFSVDGNGNLTLHYPENLHASLALGNDESHKLRFAFELDDAPDFERFFFVSSQSKFDISIVWKAAQSLAKDTDKAKTDSLDLPKSFEKSSITLLKEGFLDE